MNKKPLFQPKTQICQYDSSKIYFTTYPNPFYDRSFVWFYNELEGKLCVKNTTFYEKDTTISIYQFENEGAGLYTIEFINLEYGDFALEVNKRQTGKGNKPDKIILAKWELFLNDTLKCYWIQSFNNLSPLE